MNKNENRYNKFIDEATVNLSQHDYDVFIENSIQKFSEAGLKSTIIRRQLAKCCDYCARLAGVYEYAPGKYPEDIFSRHENCRCLVTVKTEKSGYQNVWTKIEYRSQREARIAREQEIDSQSSLNAQYLKAKNIAKSNGEQFFDATDYWIGREKVFPAYTKTENREFEFRGVVYSDENSDIDWMPGAAEKQFAEDWCQKFGGEVIYIPRVNKPEDVRTPDYLISGEYYELKQPIGTGGNTLYHQVESDYGKGNIQAENLIIDLANSDLKNDIEEVKKQVDRILHNTRYSWLKKLVITINNNIIMAFEKT